MGSTLAKIFVLLKVFTVPVGVVQLNSKSKGKLDEEAIPLLRFPLSCKKCEVVMVHGLCVL